MPQWWIKRLQKYFQNVDKNCLLQNLAVFRCFAACIDIYLGTSQIKRTKTGKPVLISPMFRALIRNLATFLQEIEKFWFFLEETAYFGQFNKFRIWYVFGIIDQIWSKNCLIEKNQKNVEISNPCPWKMPTYLVLVCRRPFSSSASFNFQKKWTTSASRPASPSLLITRYHELFWALRWAR